MSRIKRSNFYTYEYFRQERICRICWCERGVRELSTFINNKEEEPLTIADKITECIGIDISLNSFPRKICKKCLNEVELYSSFKTICHENERLLAEILQRGPIKEEKVPNYEQAETDDRLSNLNFDNYEINFEEDDITESKFETVTSDDIKLSSSILLSKQEFVENNLKIHIETPLQPHSHLNEKGILKQEKKRSYKKKAPNYCATCKIDFLTNESIFEHNSEVHQIIDKLYKCLACEKKFKLKNLRFKHEKYFCKLLKQGFNCEKCETFLPTRKIWEHHYMAHKKNKKITIPDNMFECKKCEKVFKNMQLLNEHRKIHNRIPENRFKYVCDECGRAFARRDYFNKHKMSHKGLKPHKCPHCDFKAVQKSTLNIHLRRHTGERPYACDLCEKRFSTSSNLLSHRKLHHLGIKLYQCQHCEKKFSYKQSLEEHLASIHNRSTAFSCDNCPTSFVTFRGLKRHMIKKHNLKIDKKNLKNNSTYTVGDKEKVLDVFFEDSKIVE